MKRRLTAAFLCLCLLFTLLPATAFAEGEVDSGTTIGTSGLCEHHTEHTADCGYTEGTAEIPCSHEHTEDCYTLVTKCVHTHTEDCYPADDTATPSDAAGKEPVCGHVCSEESGCITKTLDCKHEHDEACGYVPATEGTPCTFVCEVCNAQDSGDPATPSDAQPKECTCETLCTEEEINGDCPVCSAEGAELDKVCVGAAPMLPVTALAAAPGGQMIYVGNENVTSGGYWTTDNDGNVTAYTGEGTPADNYIHYDAGSNTLTLHNATIKEGVPYDTSTLIVGTAIGVLNQNGDAELTITLEGTNTIKDVSTAIYVLAPSTGSANLTITGDGILNAISGSNPGIRVQSNTSNGALAITDAKVTASSSGYSDGVQIQCGDSSNASLTVNGGSLTATGRGTYGSGIRLQFGSGDFGSGTPTVTVSGNAIVRANGSAGGIASNSSTEVHTAAGTGESGGIVFDNGTGTVYGDVTLQEDLEIGEGESLTLDDGANLSAGDHNVIVDGGTLDESLANSLGDRVKYAPAITNHPKNVEVKEDETATFTVEATGSDLSYQWQQSTDKGSSWTNIASATSDTYTTGKTTMDMSGTQYRCVVKNSIDEVTSDAATLTVQKSTTPIDPKYVRYIVEHYKQNADGSYTLADTEQPIDEIGKTVTATPKTYEGYTYNPNAAGTVVSGTLKAISSPDDIVTLKLYYDITLYTVTVNGSYAQTTGAGSYAKDATVTIDAGTRSGYTFDGWTSADGVTFANAGNAQTTFTMPDKAVTVTASWKKNSGGGGGGSSYDYYPITASAGTGGSISPSGSVSVREDTDKTFTITPAEGYIIADVLVDGVSVKHQLTNRQYIFKDVWTSHTIKASFAWVGAGTVSPFTDVKTSDWFYAAVMDVYQRGIMSGTSSTTFSPYADTTRSQLAVILWRMAGSPVVNFGLDYTDVPQGQWYSEAIRWAASEGIVGGYGNGLFGTNDPITREQFAVMLYRFAQEQGYDVSIGENTNILSYTDAFDISEFAVPALQWACGAGIITGTGDGFLFPQGWTTRAQAAAMLVRFCQKYIEK